MARYLLQLTHFLLWAQFASSATSTPTLTTTGTTSGTTTGTTTSTRSIVPASCVAVFNGDVRNCCPNTGICQDSSCTVFGFPSSAKATCHPLGAKSHCAGSYCNWVKPSCTFGNGKCYGTVACNTSSCFGSGQPCLENGNSVNFKICGSACSSDSDCPSGSTCSSGTCAETTLGSSDIESKITSYYGQATFTLGFSLSMSLSALLSLISKITVTEVISADSATYSYIDISSTTSLLSSLKLATASGISLSALDIVSWASSAKNAVAMSASVDSTGFAKLGLKSSSAVKYFSLFSLDQISSTGSVLTNAFTFRVTLSGSVSGLTCFSHSKDDTLGLDITLQGGSVTSLGNNVYEIKVMKGLAFSIGILQAPDSGSSYSSVTAYSEIKYQHVKYDVSGITSLSTTDLALLASAITTSEVITSTVSVFSYLVAQASQTISFMTTQSSGTSTAIAATSMAVESWGDSVVKAVTQSYAASSDGFALMGLVHNPKKIYSFLVSFDRLTSSGTLKNDVPLTLIITLPTNVATLTILTYNASFTSGVDITTEGGSVVYLGSGKWQIKMMHTSAASGDVTTSSDSGSSDSNNGLFGLLALLALIPLVAICGAGIWWYARNGGLSRADPAPQGMYDYGNPYSQAAYPSSRGAYLAPTPIEGPYAMYPRY